MTLELNRELPPEKRFSFFELREHLHEFRPLHEHYFPVSVVRTAWRVVMVLSAMLIATALVLAIKPK
jgi:hypothetical protein